MTSHNDDVIGNEADETSPLLGREEWQPSTRSNPVSQDQLQSPWRIALVLCLGVFLWTVSSTYLLFPELQLAEDAVCNRYYLHHPHVNATLQPHDGFSHAPWDRCDVPGTQLRVSNLLQLKATLTAVVGVVVAYPFGVLADKIGRRPVYAVAAAGQVAAVLWSLIVFAGWRALPVQLVLIAPVFQLFGGGMPVGTAVLYAILSDVMPIRSRTMWFFFLAFVAVVGAQSGAYVSVALTNWSPWGALIVFLILGLFNASLPLLIPETLKLDPTEEELLAERITIQEARDAFVRRSAFREHITEAWHSLATIVDNRSIALIILTTMVLAATHQQLVTLFLSNIRRRFNDHHGAVSTPFAIYNFAYLPIFAVFFPLLTYFLTPPRSGLSYFRRDLLLARISAAFIPVGFLLLGMPNMAVVIAGLAAFTLSIGLGPLLQSLVTHYVESGKTARLFALIGALVTIQWFVADPFFLWLSGESIRLSPFWHGLPFLVLAALGALVAVALWFVRSEVFIVVIPRDGGDDDARLLDEESIAQIE